jgi:hypothetical protein
MLSACATESVLLNSERIEQRFGSCGIEVLASEAGLRRSGLLSYDGDTATCRTYAVVQFAEQLDERFDKAHSRVLAGDSIGATFKDDGWDIRKHTLYIGTVRLPGNPIKMTGMDGTISNPAPMHGEHTEEVLNDLLGLDAAQIAALRSGGAVK